MPKSWVNLYNRHQEMRKGGALGLDKGIRRILINLADQGHCNRTVQGRVKWDVRQGRLQRLSLDQEPLSGLEDVTDALLTVLALADRRDHTLHWFSVMIEACRADDQTRWTVAVHLVNDRTAPDQDRCGLGACTHAALHCHVGPTLDAVPKVRVPFAAVGATDALHWVLSTAVPAWEPAPWDEVVAWNAQTGQSP